MATRKIKISPNSIVDVLCSVLITEWDQLGIQVWAPLPVLQSQSWVSFH
jgi:hypothetical protein